jgi:calcineurin-like phosphoesterase family protein
MKKFITSDLHFGHSNIIKFCPRTRGHFSDVNHMNSEMKRMWNEQVQPWDTVYIVGDVAFGRVEKAVEHVNALNGIKILVVGNHDEKMLNEPMFRACFAEVHTRLKIVHNGHQIVMDHHPILEWENMHRGALHFYGHLHDRSAVEIDPYRARNVGWDCTGNIVTPLEDMIADALKGAIKAHH